MRLLREEKKIPYLSIYGQSMGSIFAALAAEKLGDFDIIPGMLLAMIGDYCMGMEPADSSAISFRL